MTEIVALEPHAGLRARAVRRAAESGRNVDVVAGSGEELPFEVASFDSVVSMLVLCTVPHPPRALAEARRVLRADGSLVFFEHVRADDPKRARWQDRLERPWGVVAAGCHPNRDTLAALRAAGFDPEIVERGELSMSPPIVKPYVIGRA